MEQVKEYILNHPEITGGRFSWYDLFLYHGIVRGQYEHIGARVLGEDISIDTDDRAGAGKIPQGYNFSRPAPSAARNSAKLGSF